MGFFSSLFKGIATAASAIIDVATIATKAIVSAAGEIWDSFSGGSKTVEAAEHQQYKADDELHDINEELLTLMSRLRERGSLTEAQRRRAEYLKERRDELKSDITEAGVAKTAKDIRDNNEAFDKVEIDDDRTHIIQGQVGVSAFGKTCPSCGREMIIQWPRNTTTATASDFFWGCSGFYSQGALHCRSTLPMAQGDLDIFTKLDTPEATITSSELSEIVLLPGPKEIITERMNDLHSDKNSSKEGVDDYRCPIHGEKLVLRKKNVATNLLDQYFLGCNHWSHDGHGCTYIVKLKSPMQLSTLLKKETGFGVL